MFNSALSLLWTHNARNHHCAHSTSTVTSQWIPVTSWTSFAGMSAICSFLLTYFNLIVSISTYSSKHLSLVSTCLVRLLRHRIKGFSPAQNSSPKYYLKHITLCTPYTQPFASFIDIATVRGFGFHKVGYLWISKKNIAMLLLFIFTQSTSEYTTSALMSSSVLSCWCRHLVYQRDSEYIVALARVACGETKTR